MLPPLNLMPDNRKMATITPYHGNHGSKGDDGGNVNLAKGTAMLVLFCTSFILGTLPIKLSKWFKWESNARNNQYVKLLLGLGGGVLLCTTFIHLLPEVSENLEDLDLTPDVEIPFAELLMCMGFFLMYLVEECVHVYLHRKEKANDLRTVRRSLSIRRGEFDFKEDDITESLKPKIDRYQPNNEHNHHVGHSHVVIDYADHSTVKTIRGLLVVLALSVHELFEGLAVGLESSAGTVWYMFGAVSAHKFVIAFCIGVELVTSNLRTLLVVIYVFTFAVVSPLGIGIGIIVSNTEQDNATVVSVILQGFATGTLLYVVFFEILQADKKSGIKQFLSVLVGFVIMFGLTLID